MSLPNLVMDTVLSARVMAVAGRVPPSLVVVEKPLAPSLMVKGV